MPRKTTKPPKTSAAKKPAAKRPQSKTKFILARPKMLARDVVAEAMV